MKQNSFWTVCDAEVEGAEALFVSMDGEDCLHAIQQTYSPEACAALERELAGLVLVKRNHSGSGASYGQARCKDDPDEKSEPLGAGCAVVENGCIIGGVVTGEREEDTMDGCRSSKRRLFLPIGGEARLIKSSYYYRVYVFDGTSSEYVTKTYAAVKRAD